MLLHDIDQVANVPQIGNFCAGQPDPETRFDPEHESHVLQGIPSGNVGSRGLAVDLKGVVLEHLAHHLCDRFQKVAHAYGSLG
jgi:hypothetical protein